MREIDFKPRPYRSRQRPRWKYAVSFHEAGKRKVRLFEKRVQAKAFAKFKETESKRQGRTHAEFPERLRVEAQHAVERLQPFGKSITDAVEHYVAHLEATAKSCSVEQLVAKLLKAKAADGLSERHVDNLRSRLKVFAAQFDGRPVATITSVELDHWLRSLPVGPVTRNNYRRILVQAFNHAVAHGYATANPAMKTALAKEHDLPPGILTVSQTARLLEAASPEVLPYIALGLFAGLRRAELERLAWGEIDFGSGLIEVTAKKSKTARRRFVTIQPNLRAWLMPVRKLRGEVTPEELIFRQLFDQAREAAGLDEWPANALRHSFASYHLAHFKNAGALALELGHSNSGMIFAHYREIVKPKEAERYWSIRPVRTRKVVAFKA